MEGLTYTDSGRPERPEFKVIKKIDARPKAENKNRPQETKKEDRLLAETPILEIPDDYEAFKDEDNEEPGELYEYTEQADRLALTHNIPGHEFSDYPPAPNRDFVEVMRIALESRLRPGATAERMGFAGFDGKTVVDVGTRDGRYVQMFTDLGAKEVYGVDPDKEELEKAVNQGLLDERHALTCTLQDLPKEKMGTFEVATVFHFNMPIPEQKGFFIKLYESLTKNGQVVMTVAEDKTLQNIIRFIEPLFSMQVENLWNRHEDYPHKNLVILTKKPLGFKIKLRILLLSGERFLHSVLSKISKAPLK